MFVVDTVCIAAFTAELLLRTVAAPATIGLRRFLCSPANWVDVAAILPYFLELPTSDFVPRPDGGDDDGAGGVAALSVLRVIRLARLARVLKVSRSMTGFLVLLRTIGKSLVPLGMLMVFVLSMSIFFTIVIGDALALMRKDQAKDGVYGEVSQDAFNFATDADGEPIWTAKGFQRLQTCATQDGAIIVNAVTGVWSRPKWKWTGDGPDDWEWSPFWSLTDGDWQFHG